MKIVVVTCLWKRPVISDRVLARYVAAKENLRDEVELDFVAVGSEGEESESLSRRHGWHYVEFPNQPLGAKWNRGMAHARELEADAVVVVGSDDWLSDGIFRHHIAKLDEGSQVSFFRGVHIMCSKTLECVTASNTGLGRCIHSSLMDAVDWAPWPPAKGGRLDGYASLSLREAATRPISCVITDKVPGGRMLDIKSETNLWSFAYHKRRASKTVPLRDALAPFDPVEVSDLMVALGHGPHS